jgi:hypothetical protein
MSHGRLNSAIPISATGIVWYSRDAYPRCLKIFDDADELPETFEEWLAIAERAERDAQNRGLRVIRAELHPESFLAWCAANGHVHADSSARADFANHVAGELLLAVRD